jgi:hypothetical protein
MSGITGYNCLSGKKSGDFLPDKLKSMEYRLRGDVDETFDCGAGF